MKKGYFLVFLTAVISGFSIFINRFGVSISNPYLFTFSKNLAVAILLTGLIFAKKEWIILRELTKKQWLLLIIIGLIGGSIPFLFFFKGLSLISAAQGSFWHKTMFLYVAILAGVFLKEKINWRFIFGGAILIFANLLLLKKIPHSLNRGDFLVFLATLFWAAENVVSKYTLRKIDSKTLAWGRMFFGSIFILVFLLSTQQLSSLINFNFMQIGWVIVTSLLLLGYQMTWYGGLKFISVSEATVILTLGSPITTLLSFTFRGKISNQEIFSGFLIILGIISIIGFKKIWQIIKDFKKVNDYARA